jgi:signal transduction histidine kinase
MNIESAHDSTGFTIPRFVMNRLWWLLPLAVWAVMVGYSLNDHIAEQGRQSLRVATEGARNMFRMIVLTRSWVAGHGGVYVPVTPKNQPNPYLNHPRRDLVTTDGTRLTMINPAFMTRQLAELANINEGAIFHITSLKPIRPMNAADPWESEALKLFEQGEKEHISVVPAGGMVQLRYMAPLVVKPPCMTCHAQQGYKVGDIRGGISVSLPYAPIEDSLAPLRRHAYQSHAIIFTLVALLGWLLLETLRRRWRELRQNMVALKDSRASLENLNQSLEKARDAAETASRSKSAFITTMSHELHTPMNGVLGMAELLRNTDLDAKQRDYLDTLLNSGRGLMRILNAVTDYARLDSEQADAARVAPFSIDRVLNEVRDRLEAQATTKGIAFLVEPCAPPVGPLLGDADRIQGILLHLAGNAIKFTDAGSVTLAADATHVDAERMRIQFSVRDTGIGISQEVLPKLFQPFEIADATTTRRHGGIGLGLAICKRLADSLGGRLSVASTQNSGSVFTLDLILQRTDASVQDLSPGEIERLDSLLANDDIEASDLFRALAPALSNYLGEQYPLMERQIANFEYDKALATLRQALPRFVQRL